MSLKRFIENPDKSTVELLVSPLLSIMSFMSWQKAQEESFGIVALTHSGTTKEGRLKPSGWGGGSMLCRGGLGHNATGVPSPLWTTVILQKPLY